MRGFAQCNANDSLFIIALNEILIVTKGVYRASEKKAGRKLFGIRLLMESVPLSFKQKFALSVVTIFALIVEK